MLGRSSFQALVLIIVLVPSLVSSQSERKRRRPQVDNDSQFYDQLAQSTAPLWPDRYVTSLSHTQVYQDQGDLSHSNYVLTVQPKKRPRNIGDLPLEDNLDNAHSAEDYVQRAIQNHNHQGYESKRIPSSTFSKYNLIEQPIAVEIKKEPAYVPPPPPPKQVHHYGSLKHNIPKTVTPQAIIVKDVYPTATSNVIDGDVNAQYYRDRPVKHHILKIIEAEAAPSTTSSLTDKDKSQIMSHIEESVFKLFNELERKRKREENPKHYAQDPVSYSTTSTTKVPPSHRHRPDKSSSVSDVDLTFKHPKHRPRPIDLSALDVGQTWNHGSSFDHSAILKTAQGFDQSNAVAQQQQQHQTESISTSTSHRQPHKLHFNQQTYHDINSLPYTAEKENNDNSYYYKGYSYPESSGGASTKNNHETSVGATISFGSKPEYNVQIINPTAHAVVASEDLNPIHIINGIPVSNPYKMDVNAIRFMLNGLSQAQVYDTKEKYRDETDEVIKSENSNWEPYHTQPKPTKQLPYDSYSPKYNNNPQGYGYQENYQVNTPHITSAPVDLTVPHNKKIKNDGTLYKWNEGSNGGSGGGGEDSYNPSASSSSTTWSTGSDPYSGSSTTTKIRIQRVPKNKRPHHAKRSNKSTNSARGTSDKNNSKRSRDLEVELRPPPRYIKA